MKTYLVQCAGRDGPDYALAVEAETADAARQWAADAGHLAGQVHEWAAPPAEVKQSSIAAGPLIIGGELYRRPVRTIAKGVLLALGVVAVVGLLVQVLALGGLAVLLKALSGR